MKRGPRSALSAAVLVRSAGALLAVVVVGGCGATPLPIGPRGIDELTIPTPSPDPTDFPAHDANPWFPLTPGTRWTYRQYAVTGYRTLVVTVLPHRRSIDGVQTTGVAWRVRGPQRTRTAMVRWYAVDRAGNVWWFGQDTTPHSPHLDALATSSWLAGSHGAEAGLLISAAPRIGDGYLNAFEPRVVERRSTVLSLSASVATTEHTYRHTVAIQDLSTLAPLHTVESYYARGLGLVAQSDSGATSTTLALEQVRHG